MPADPFALDSLRAAADSLGPLTTETITLPWSRAALCLTRPVDLDALLDRAAADPEEHLPYWSEIWPSGLALADAIACRPETVAGRRVVELGCGLGATALAAVAAGADLLAADYAPEALLLCRLNALANGLPEPATFQLNWRRPAPALDALAGAGVPLVLAADLLYESRDVEPLFALLDRLVAPAGTLWLAEPGRPVAHRFLDAARSTGWRITSTTHHGPWPDPKDAGVVVGLHELRRGA